MVQCRHAAGRHQDLQRAADALARDQPQVILALTHLNADAAQRATRRIPIVFIASGDPNVLDREPNAGPVESSSTTTTDPAST